MNRKGIATIIFIASCTGCVHAQDNHLPQSSSKLAVTMQNPAYEPYSVSFEAGSRDDSGNFLGGSELINLVGFKGKLYAGIGYWMDQPDFFADHIDPTSAAQVLVLDSKGGKWRQEVVFDDKDTTGKFKYVRLSSMKNITFHEYDDAGKMTKPLTEMLVASLDGNKGALFAQVDSGGWRNLNIPASSPVRSFAVHFNPYTKTEKLYIGSGRLTTSNGAIFSGTYDPDSPNQMIRWNTKPEFSGFPNRVMSFEECEGKLFFAAKPKIYRLDDKSGNWEVLYSYPLTHSFDKTKYVSGFRALTCVPDSDHPNKKILLSGFEGTEGDIIRIDPQTSAAQVELNSRKFLSEKWDSKIPPTTDIIVGYSNLPYLESSGEGAYLFGLLARNPNKDDINSAWFLSRNGSHHTYKLHRVNPIKWTNIKSDQRLFSVRAIAISPFPEDQGKVIFLGGYDGHFKSVHNTAWLYRVGIETALKPHNNFSN